PRIPEERRIQLEAVLHSPRAANFPVLLLLYSGDPGAGALWMDHRDRPDDFCRRDFQPELSSPLGPVAGRAGLSCDRALLDPGAGGAVLFDVAALDVPFRAQKARRNVDGIHRDRASYSAGDLF